MYRNYPYIKDERNGFLFPFLLGGLAGGAVVGVSRPRPVIAYNNPYPMPMYGPYPYYPYY